MNSNAATAMVKTTEARPRVSSVSFSLHDTDIIREVYGSMDQNLMYLERRLSVTISTRGNELHIDGAHAEDAQDIIRDLYRCAECGQEDITTGYIDSRISAILGDGFTPASDDNVIPHVSIRTRKKTIVPRNHTQSRYISAMQREDLVFGLGPAGTGKTYLAVAQAIEQLITGKVKRLIFSRPAVEAGEKLGFLPGDMKDKVDPYLRPIYDALYDCLDPAQVERYLASGEIEIAPIAFMRGRTLADAFIILDEAQNTTREQLKMFLTRFGEGSRMVICGDPKQTDLPGGSAASGLTDAMNRLSNIEEIEMITFSAADIVRHPIVGRIVEAYEGENASA